jgi:hypothetical protein
MADVTVVFGPGTRAALRRRVQRYILSGRQAISLFKVPFKMALIAQADVGHDLFHSRIYSSHELFRFPHSHRFEVLRGRDTGLSFEEVTETRGGELDGAGHFRERQPPVESFFYERNSAGNSMVHSSVPSLKSGQEPAVVRRRKDYISPQITFVIDGRVEVEPHTVTVQSARRLKGQRAFEHLVNHPW